MSRRIILSPDARANLQSAARWYRREDMNLSRRFKAEVWQLSSASHATLAHSFGCTVPSVAPWWLDFPIPYTLHLMRSVCLFRPFDINAERRRLDDGPG